MKTWFLYVLLSTTGTFYVGVSTDPEKRLRQHNGEIKGGASSTRAHRPWSLLCSFEYADQSEAQKAEYRVKQWTVAKKRGMFQAHALENPEWKP